MSGFTIFPPQKIDPASNGKRFIPPNADDTPNSLFSPGFPITATIPAPRWLRRTNNREGLIFTDGACLNNGADNATAGCAFVFRPETSFDFMMARIGDPDMAEQFKTLGDVAFRLEHKGPDGTIEAQTSNRAELRAVIAVLEFRYWVGEGIQRLVIATDSTYVVDGATEWIHTWQRNGWRTSKKTPVANKDLWQYLIKKIADVSENGMELLFWKIPRASNAVADQLAKAAATQSPTEEFAEILGVAC